jgi:hypothetical protein
MKKLAHISIIIFTLLAVLPAHGQKKKVWVSGAARGVLYGDDYKNNAEEDTVTARKVQSGSTLVDLGVNIQPNDKILIQGMVRIRNDYGGFWGSGVTFDVRQLYIKGIIAGVVKYQLGDINYKLTPYTFGNNVGLVSKYKGVMTGITLDQVQYDVFYTKDNTWRQQGAAIDFGLQFNKGVEDLEFNLFTTRNRPTNFESVDDRLYSGGSITLKQSKYFRIAGQYANLYDFAGTSNSDVHMRNPAYSGSAELSNTFGKTQLNLSVETGRSKLDWEGLEEAPILEDYFYDFNLKGSWSKLGLSALIGYRDVGPDYRSAGAQTMQIDYTAAPQAYQRYGNDQELRKISMFDIYRDASLYQTQIKEGLMVYDPRYDNATPYGVATPNRKGFKLNVEYEDLKKRWLFKADGELLSDIVGQGTSYLKNYNTASLFAEFRFDKMLKLENRRLWLSGVVAAQNTTRTGDKSYENVDLSTLFYNFNLTATLFADLDFIAEYRVWQSKGFDLVADRNEFSEIIDYNEYTVDYNESMVGAGLQYRFATNIKLSLLYETFIWKDFEDQTLPYTIDTWTVFFTMKF